MRAGSISDVPYVCNNGRDGAVDGRQPFLPVGVPAVNSGSVVGATPCLALWRPPAAGGPAALCGSWCGKLDFAQNLEKYEGSVSWTDPTSHGRLSHAHPAQCHCISSRSL